jgi:hypothetical protein
MSDTNSITLVNDAGNSSFYFVLADGSETDWASYDELAVADDGSRTYVATMCGDFPGMQPGKVYAIGAELPTVVEDYDPEADGGEDEEDDEDEVEEEGEVEEEDDDADDDAEDNAADD